MFDGSQDQLAYVFRKRLLCAVVIPEALFIKIPEQMEWLNADVCPMESALQETPEVFHGVRVDVPFTYSTA